MPEFLNFVQTKDVYDPALQLGPTAPVKLITFSVIAEPALVTFWKPAAGMGGRPVLEAFERLYVANSIGIEAEGVVGVRFRSAIAGSPASIVAELALETDPRISGGSVSSAAISSSGQVATVPTIPRVTALPTNPIDQQICSLIVDPLQTTWPGVEWLLIFNASTGFWDFLGGSPLVKQDRNGSQRQNTVDNTWELIGGQPSIALPLAGEYEFTYGATFIGDNAVAADLVPASSQAQALTALPHISNGVGSSLAGNQTWSVASECDDLSNGYTRAAEEIVSLWQLSTSHTNTGWQFGWLRATPIRVHA